MTRTERIYYVVVAAYCLPMLIVPAYPLFLMSRGLDVLQMNVVLASYLIGCFVFEVPTGAFADLFGRKAAFLASCAVRFCAFTLYAFAGGFGDCLVAELIDALGKTLASGALDAWAVDGMRDEGHRGPADRLFSRAQMLMRTVMVVSGVAGGYIAQRSFRVAWLAAGSGFVIAGGIAFFAMKERGSLLHARRERSAMMSMRDAVVGVRDAFMTVRREPVLRLLCVLTAALAFPLMPLGMFWQPRLQELSGEGPWLMGWVSALWNIGIVLGGALLPRLQLRLRRDQILLGVCLWSSCSFAIMTTATSLVAALAGVVLTYFSFAFTDPVLQAWMNDEVSSERRATLLSMRAMSYTCGGSIGLLVVGAIAKASSRGAAMLGASVFFWLAAPGFVWLGRIARGRSQSLPVTQGTNV